MLILLLLILKIDNEFFFIKLINVVLVVFLKNSLIEFIISLDGLIFINFCMLNC